MIELLIKLILGYLLGSVSGSLLLGRFRAVDIRKLGSGNAGGTNAFRTQGTWFGLGVVVIDIGKGALAAGWLAGLLLPGLAHTDWMGVPLACGLAAILGHCYPVYHGFRGGKGAGTVIGVLAATAPWMVLPLVLSWLLILVLTGYVSLATMGAGVAMLPSALLSHSPADGASLVWFSIIMAVFLIFTHRSNISNLRSGAEHRFERALVKNWRK